LTQEETYEGLFREQLEDLYDAERQIVDALPGMIRAVSSEELRTAFEGHLEQTRQQLERLQKIFSELGIQASGKPCEGMRGLLAEGRKIISEHQNSEVLDAALIAAAQKVEHYEISGYGTARTLAEVLNHEEAAELLEQTLEEEKDTDELLTDIAEDLLAGEDFEEAEDEEEEEDVA
jgi:ferritin-like metal-binding protein YciE